MRKVTSVLLGVTFYVLSTVIYMKLEDWDAVEAIYFITTTFTTVGYGDVAAKTRTGRLLVGPVVFCGVVFVLAPLARMAAVVSKSWKFRSLDDLPVESHSPEAIAMRARRIQGWKYIVEGLPVALLVLGVILTSLFDADTSILDALYFAVQTCTTIGYGDIKAPTTTTRRRLITSVSLLCLVVFASNLFNDLQKINNERIARESRHHLDLEHILVKKIHRRQRAVVTESDYVLAVLEQQGLIDKSIVLALRRYYHWRVADNKQLNDERAEESPKEENGHPRSSRRRNYSDDGYHDEISLKELYRRRRDTNPITFDDWVDSYWAPKLQTNDLLAAASPTRNQQRTRFFRFPSKVPHTRFLMTSPGSGVFDETVTPLSRDSADDIDGTKGPENFVEMVRLSQDKEQSRDASPV